MAASVGVIPSDSQPSVPWAKQRLTTAAAAGFPLARAPETAKALVASQHAVD